MLRLDFNAEVSMTLPTRIMGLLLLNIKHDIIFLHSSQCHKGFDPSLYSLFHKVVELLKAFVINWSFSTSTPTSFVIFFSPVYVLCNVYDVSPNSLQSLYVFDISCTNAVPVLCHAGIIAGSIVLMLIT